MNTFYVDCNRQNSLYKDNQNNEWTYKLNTEMLLPKGTSIQIQNTFINKKGITGGSIEIEEDYIDSIKFYKYITETAQIQPVATYVDQSTPWFRTTLHCDPHTFKGHFRDSMLYPDGVDDGQADDSGHFNRIIQGEKAPVINFFSNSDDNNSKLKNYNTTLKTPDFGAFGGNSQILPHFRWTSSSQGGGGRVVPKAVFHTLDFKVPKGVYGIGELAQLIEDQMNGVKVYDRENDILLTRTDFENRLTKGFDNDLERFDGNFENRPFLQNINLASRAETTTNKQPIVGDDGFLNMTDYLDMVEWERTQVQDIGFKPDPVGGGIGQNWDWDSMSGANPLVRGQVGISPIKPYYILRDSIDNGTNITYQNESGSNTYIGTQHNADDTLTASEYWNYRNDFIDDKRTRRIGTTNFSLKYDSEKNGFSINGLHNVMRSPSHDRFGGKTSSAGQPVINFKKCRRGAFRQIDITTGNGDDIIKRKKDVATIIGNLNIPETRDMGISITNFSTKYSTTEGVRTNRVINPDSGRFQDWFTTKNEAKKQWENTIWFKMGFTYEQLNEPNIKTPQYTRGFADVYGFTTNSPLTNDIIPTISSLNNPLEFNIPNQPSGSKAPEIAGLQMFNSNSNPMPFSDITESTVQGSYANSNYTEAVMVPTIISDVGGIVGARLPTLSTHPYYLITSDLCDNYKDNVKKGDVLPLLGVVGKSSLSNQDFITSENDIVQVLSQDKVINKIHLKILNPDLTAPELDTNSSIVLKITVPNRTPSSLLPPPIQKQLEEKGEQLIGL